MRELVEIILLYLKDRKNFFMRLVEKKALGYLEVARRYNLHNLEEIEDLLFHIQSYIDIEATLKETMFNNKINADNYTSYKFEIEKHKAVERDFIYEGMKKLPEVLFF